MSLKWYDAFPYATADLPKRYGASGVDYRNCTIETTTGRFGGRYFKYAPPSADQYFGIYKAIANTEATLCVQCGFRVAAMVTVAPIFYFDDTNTCQWGLILLNSGLISARNGSNVQFTNGISINPLSQQTWHQLEVKFTIADSGSVLVKVDGIEEINISGVDTLASANAFVNKIRLAGYYGITANAYEVHFSDLIIMDTLGSRCNDLLGNKRVRSFMPVSEGYYKETTPSTGNRNETIDEIPPSEADYNVSTAIGDRDTFTHSSITNLNANIDAIICEPYAKTIEAGAAGMSGLVRSNSIDALGPEITIPSSSNWLGSILYYDPNTSNPFTVTGFNAAEFGYKRSA